METLTNQNGEEYCSKINSDGQRIYSFSKSFNDIWSEEDEAAIASGTTPNKFSNQ
jgi:hypothetical protein